MRELNFGVAHEEMHKNREALDRHDGTNEWTATYDPQDSSKPDGLTEDDKQLAEIRDLLEKFSCAADSSDTEAVKDATMEFLRYASDNRFIDPNNCRDEFEIFCAVNGVGIGDHSAMMKAAKDFKDFLPLPEGVHEEEQ